MHKRKNFHLHKGPATLVYLSLIHIFIGHVSTVTTLNVYAHVTDEMRKTDVYKRQVVAIGDSMNDMGMLQWAGTGVAVANGEPELKAVADRLVCSNQEHGVRQCVEQILLPMLHQAGPASGL